MFPISILRTAWIGVALFAAGWVWELVRFWGVQPDYADRFLILVAAGWLAWQAWPEITARPAQPSALGLPAVLAGALIFPVGWFLFVQVGPRIILTWWGYTATLLMAVGVLAATRGWSAVRRLAFPLLFLAMAPQLPGRLYSPLQKLLQTLTTQLSAAGLSACGLSVVREGYVLRLPSGDLGVIEACSGVRSITALTAMTLFLSYLRGLRLCRGTAALALAIPVIILVNASRIIATGLLQEWVDRSAILGWKHEALGFAAVFLGLGLVAGITGVLRPKSLPVAPPPPAELPAEIQRRGLLVAILGCLLLGLALTAAATAMPSLTNTVDASGETIDKLSTTVVSKTPDGDRIQWTAGPNLPIPEETTKELEYTHGVNRVYKDPLGNDVIVFAFHWTSATAVKGYHHPDVCLPGRGWKVTSQSVEPVTTPGGRTVPVTYREFRRDDADLSVAYWTQEGRRIWTDRDEVEAFSFLYPFRWVGERLKPRRADDVDDRLVFWCYRGQYFTGGKTRLLGFVGGLADEVYRVCPWADPADSAKSR